jgi:hypothetical protein
MKRLYVGGDNPVGGAQSEPTSELAGTLLSFGCLH